MGRGLDNVTLGKFGLSSIISPKPVRPESYKFVHIFTLALPTSVYNIISERRRGLGHATPKIFGIPSSISPKPIKLECSKLARGFSLALLTSLKHNISERRRGLGHVTPRKFGISLTISRKIIPSTISHKAIKLETSNLVRGFDLALPTIWSYNIYEKGRGLGYVTPRIFGIPQMYFQTGKARQF